MASYRAERLSELIHRELAHRLRVEIKDSRVDNVSITGVEVSRDLQHAKVHYLPLGGGEAPPELHDALQGAGRALRGPIGRALRLRRAPELTFELDLQFERAMAVTSLLRGIQPDSADDDPEDWTDAGAEDGEEEPQS
jgi:ribosome-binding factor A